METTTLNYRRYLPHWQKPGATYFITFRLHGSLPAAALAQLRNRLDADLLNIKQQNLPKEQYIFAQTLRKRYFADFEKLLDQVKYGPDHLKHSAVAEIVANKIKEFDNTDYVILAYCIMPNHVHLLIDTSIQIKEEDQWEESFKPLHKIMQRIKGGSALLCNKILNRSGTFWQKESYDHLIRSQKELVNVVNYILYNPVKAGLCQHWEEWPFTYVTPTLVGP